MNRLPLVVNLFAVGLFVCAHSLMAAQRTFVSAASGNDANVCSRAFPCRNFTAAITQTDPDGEVIVLDSGGYGVVTIPKSVSLISPNGVYAGITSFLLGTAVTVNAGDTAHVVLKNLQLNSQGGGSGIDVDTVGALYVEGCVINGFSFFGILFDPTTTGARLYVTDTAVRRSGNTAIYVSGGTGFRATVDSVQLHQNLIGIYAFNADVTIRDSVASGGSSAGFWAHTGTKVSIENSVAGSNDRGFFADDSGVMNMSRCTSSSNTTGVRAETSGLVYISESSVTGNGTGVSTATGGVVTSRSNNTLQANTTNGSFNGSFTAN